MSSLLLFGVLLCLLVNNKVTKAKKQCFDVNTHRSWTRLARRDACGVSAVHPSYTTDRVMGGSNADLGEFPWMARLFYRGTKGVEAMCGGSIIHEKYVLTAAHCCSVSKTLELLFVRLGEYDALTDEDCYKTICAPKHVDIKVEKTYSHEKYKPLEYLNDICLIKLRKKVIFSDYIYPICLPVDCNMQENQFESNMLTAAGWGGNSESRTVEILQRLKLGTVERRTCEKLWNGEGYYVRIDDTKICAGREVNQDVCAGDSGGPLMYKSSTSGEERQYAVGVVSVGLPCSHRNNSNLPGIYTKISPYLTWIFLHLEKS